MEYKPWCLNFSVPDESMGKLSEEVKSISYACDELPLDLFRRKALALRCKYEEREVDYQYANKQFYTASILDLMGRLPEIQGYMLAGKMGLSNDIYQLHERLWGWLTSRCHTADDDIRKIKKYHFDVAMVAIDVREKINTAITESACAGYRKHLEKAHELICRFIKVLDGMIETP